MTNNERPSNDVRLYRTPQQGEKERNEKQQQVQNLQLPYKTGREVTDAPKIFQMTHKEGEEKGNLPSGMTPAPSVEPGARWGNSHGLYDSQWENTYKFSGAKAAATAAFEQAAAEERSNDSCRDVRAKLLPSESADSGSLQRLSSAEEYSCTRRNVTLLPRFQAYEIRETRRISPKREPAFSATVVYASRGTPSPKRSVSSGVRTPSGETGQESCQRATPRTVGGPLARGSAEEQDVGSRRASTTPRSVMMRDEATTTEASLLRESAASQSPYPVMPKKSMHDASTMTGESFEGVALLAGQDNSTMALQSGPYDTEYFNAGRRHKSFANESLISLSTVSNSTYNQRRDLSTSCPGEGSPSHVAQHAPRTTVNDACNQARPTNTRPPLLPQPIERQRAHAASSYGSWNDGDDGRPNRAAVCGRPPMVPCRQEEQGSRAPPDVWAAKLRELDQAYVSSSNGWAILHEIRLILEGRRSS